MLKFPSLPVALGIVSGMAMVACTALPGHTNPAQADSTQAVAAAAASSQSASAVGPDPAKPIVERVCQSCHDIGVLSQTPHTADEWPAIVQRMRSTGADLNSAQAKLVVEYLQKNYVAKP